MIQLGTNILLQWTVRTDPLHSIVRASLRGLRASGEILCIVPQNLYEFWAAATRPSTANGLGLSIRDTKARMDRIQRVFQFLPDQTDLVFEWERLVVAYQYHGSVSYDARLVAAMRTHQLTRLLTLNTSDFARFPGLTLIDPMAGAAPTAPAGP